MQTPPGFSNPETFIVYQHCAAAIKDSTSRITRTMREVTQAWRAQKDEPEPRPLQLMLADRIEEDLQRDAEVPGVSDKLVGLLTCGINRVDCDCVAAGLLGEAQRRHWGPRGAQDKSPDGWRNAETEAVVVALTHDRDCYEWLEKLKQEAPGSPDRWAQEISYHFRTLAANDTKLDEPYRKLLDCALQRVEYRQIATDYRAEELREQRYAQHSSPRQGRP